MQERSMPAARHRNSGSKRPRSIVIEASGKKPPSPFGRAWCSSPTIIINGTTARLWNFSSATRRLIEESAVSCSIASASPMIRLSRSGSSRLASSCPFLREQNAVQKLADRLVTGTDKHPFNPFFQLARGIADFRAGRSGEAIERLQRCLKYPFLAQPQHYTLTQLFLSMAYEQAGRKDEARRTFEQARARIDAEHENWKRAGAVKGNSDWLRSMSVLREALEFFKTP